MIQQTVYDQFRLPAIANGAFTALGIDHPLQLVPAFDDDDQIIVCFDCDESKRVPMDGVFRIESQCTHVFFWLVSKDMGAQCFSFGATCVAEVLVGDRVQRLNPALTEEYNRLYGQLKKIEAPLSKSLAAWHSYLGQTLEAVEAPARLVLHPNLKECVPGVVYDESFRVADLSLSIKLTPKQLAQAARKVETWRENPPAYQIRSLKNQGKNCADFVWDVLAAAEVANLAPWGFHFKPWPGVMMRGVENKKKLYRSGRVQHAPKAVTQEMLAFARGKFTRRQKAVQRLGTLMDRKIRKQWGKELDPRLAYA